MMFPDRSTLELYYFVSQIVGAAGTVTVAVLVYIWQKRSTRAQWAATFAEQIRHFNLLVLQDDELQLLEAERHPFRGSEKFDESDVRKMYRFFLLLNVAQTMHVASRAGAVDPVSYDALIRNSARMLYADREFIKTHCFVRGYPVRFSEQIEKYWGSFDLESKPKEPSVDSRSTEERPQALPSDAPPR